MARGGLIAVVIVEARLELQRRQNFPLGFLVTTQHDYEEAFLVDQRFAEALCS